MGTAVSTFLTVLGGIWYVQVSAEFMISQYQRRVAQNWLRDHPFLGRREE